MGFTYPDPYDNFVKRKFRLAVPNYYEPIERPDIDLNVEPHKKPELLMFMNVMTNPRPREPFFVRAEPHQKSMAFYSLETQLDMFLKGVVYTYLDDPDVVEVFIGIDRFLMYLQPAVMSRSHEHVEYAKNIIKWRAQIYKLYFRYMKLNPLALDELYPNWNKDQNLFTALSAFGGTKLKMGDNLDPLVAKRSPPYDIDELIRDKEEVDKIDNNIYTGLGLTTTDSVLTDNGGDFDLNDFIKR